ncbi:MAG: glycosyltransferase family 4 protein [Tepidisphaeraceae bacterium]
MPRRILLLITDLEIGGTPTVVRELATRLHDPPDVEIEVACLKGWGPNADRLRDAGIPVSALGAKHAWQLPSVVRRFRELVRARQVDTVFSFLIHANTVAALVSKGLPGVRFFQSVQTTQYKPRWHWWLQGRIERAAERIVVPSLNVDGALRAWSGLAMGRAYIIHNAVDANAFEPHPVFVGERLRVGFVGRMDPVKRLDVAIAAVAEITEFPVQLMIFGDGPKRRDWQKWQQNTFADPDAQRFIWRGEAPTPQDAMREIDILVLPSIGEGFGLVLIEAMASGVPVIASAAGGIFDVVRHECYGLMVPVFGSALGTEKRGFADAIRRLHRDAALRERLIANGLERVREKFTWEVVIPQYRGLLGI